MPAARKLKGLLLICRCIGGQSRLDRLVELFKGVLFALQVRDRARNPLASASASSSSWTMSGVPYSPASSVWICPCPRGSWAIHGRRTSVISMPSHDGFARREKESSLVGLLTRPTVPSMASLPRMRRVAQHASKTRVRCVLNDCWHSRSFVAHSPHSLSRSVSWSPGGM